MAYTYRNRKTGDTVTTTNRVSGKNWESMEEKLQQPPEDDYMAEDPLGEAPEENAVAEDTPTEKPKAARRGKK